MSRFAGLAGLLTAVVLAGLLAVPASADITRGVAVTANQRVAARTATGTPVTLTAGPEVTSDPSFTVLGTDTARFTISAGTSNSQLVSGTIAFGDGTSDAIGNHLTWNHLYAAPGTYTATLTETDQLGQTSTASTKAVVGDEYGPAAPAFDFSGTVPAHGVLRLSAARLNAVFFASRGAYLNVTVSGAKQAGAVFAYHDGGARPADAAIRFGAGRSASNTVLVLPTADFYNASGAPVRLTVYTYALEFTCNIQNGAAEGDTYVPDGPARLLAPTGVAGGRRLTLKVAGAHGVPSGAHEVVLDVTASGAKSAGYLTAYPDTLPEPGFHVADWAAGQAVTGLVIVPLVDGKVVLHNAGAGSTVLTADIVGYFDYFGAASVFLPVSAARVLAVQIGPGRAVRLPVAGENGLPASGISAADVNLTASGASRGGTIVGWADGARRPVASTLSYGAGAIAGAAMVPVGADGALDLYNAGPAAVTLTVDLTGAYYRYP